MNQSEFLAINSNLLRAREKSRAQGVHFGFASHWLKNLGQSLSLAIAIAIAYLFSTAI